MLFFSIYPSCCFRYGNVIESFPPPEDDMKAYLSKLKAHLSSKQLKDSKVWNPVVSKDTYHINCSEAYKVYVGGSCSIM